MRRPLCLPLLVSLFAGCARAPAPPLAPCPSAPAAAPPSPATVTHALDASSPSPAAFDPAPWLDDLDALTQAMSSHYANLDFQVQVRHLDLARVKQRAEERLRAATSEDDARRAFRRFLNAFGDGHLSIDWTPRPPGAAETTTAPQTLCARLGYEDRDRGGIDFALAPGFNPIADADARDLPGGVLQLPRGKVGVVRVDLFTETAHPALCEDARAALKLANDAACDETCSGRLQIEVGNRLTAALERRLVSLANAGVAAVAVNITGNGGGSDWVDAATREMTPTRIEARPGGAVRHEHWTKELGDRIRDLEADLASHGDVEHGAIAAALVKMRAERGEVGTPCDESALWREGGAKPTCSQLVVLHPVLAYAKPGELVGRSGVDIIFGPSRYEYREGTNRLPVAVLVDGGTASAAEHFAEMLQDHRAATIVGVQTLGAGCGYTNGGIPTSLPHSGASVKMPDCARLRADGSNAVAGVSPDVVLPLLDRDSPYQRAEKVAQGLAAAWTTIVRKPKAR